MEYLVVFLEPERSNSLLANFPCVPLYREATSLCVDHIAGRVVGLETQER